MHNFFLERQWVATVDGLREFSELPEFDGCLPKLAMIRIRRALGDESWDVDATASHISRPAV